MSWISDLHDTHVDCRSLGHRWPRPKRYAHHDWIGYRLECGVCGTVRSEVRTKHGQLVHRHYAYPEGYQKPADEERAYRPEMWQEFNTRLQPLRKNELDTGLAIMLGVE